MTDHFDLIARLREPCIDWTGEPIVDGSTPRTEVHCGLLREASDALSSQSLSLSEAREEIERSELGRHRLGHALREATRQRDEALATLKASGERETAAIEAGRDLLSYLALYDFKDRDPGEELPEHMARLTAALFARSVLENGPAVLADANTNPASSDLSSLRKGAEVAALDVATRALNRIASRQEPHPVSAAFSAMTEIRALVSGSREEQADG